MQPYQNRQGIWQLRDMAFIKGVEEIMAISKIHNRQLCVVSDHLI